MKPIMRTTVILDEELRRKLKMLSVQKDISMKEIITQALEEKIQRELEGTASHDEFIDNLIVSNIGKVLEPMVGATATRIVIAQTAKKFNSTPRKLTKSDMTKEFIDVICAKVSDIAGEEDVAIIRKDLQALIKKR